MEKIAEKVLLLAIIFADVAALPLGDFYSFGSEAGDAALSRNDDGSSPSIPLPNGFPFYGLMYNELFVR